MRVLLLALVCVLACTPTGDGPKLGGQTGDPGVTEFESLDPGIDPKPPMGSAGSCSGALHVLGTEGRRLDGSFRTRVLNDRQLVLFDPARGLAVVDSSSPSPRVIGRLPLPRSVGNLNLHGNVAFVSRRNVLESAGRFGNGYPQIGDEGEILAVDLADPTRPRVLQRLPLARAPRFSVLVASEGSVRLYVISDGGAAYGCASFDFEGKIDSYAWQDGRLEPRATLSLGEVSANFSSLLPMGDKLALVRGDRRAQSAGTPMPYTLTLISLAASDGSMRETAPIVRGGVGELFADDTQTLRVFSKQNGENLLEVFDLRDLDAPARKSRCTLPDLSLIGSFNAFSPRHVFGRSGAINNTNTATSIELRPDGACLVRSHRGRWRSMHSLAPLASDRVVDVDSNERGDLVVRLLNDADLTQLDEQSVPGVGSAWIEFPTVPAFRTPAGELIVPIGVYDEHAPLGLRDSLQLVRVVGDKLEVLGKVRDASSVLDAELTPRLVWTRGKLAALDLSSLARPALSDAVDVVPNFAQVLPFDGHWLRLRLPNDEYRETLEASALFTPPQPGLLELVPIDQDPDVGEAVAQVEINPFARLVRVGSLLVALARGYPKPEGFAWDEPVATLIEVFDLRDPRAPRRVGRLELDALWLAKPCSDCTGSILDDEDLTFEHGLVLRTKQDTSTRGLRVLDLRDPAAPTLLDPIVRPTEERFVSAFGARDGLYYTYRERGSNDGAGSPPRARFYFRRVDLSDPEHPSFGEAVNVPGQLVAIDGETLYTREVTRPAGTLHMEAHRLTLSHGKARLEASHSFGERAALRLELTASGQLLVDLREPLQTLLYGTRTEITPTDLRVLDGRTLSQLAETYVGPGATRLMTVGERSLYGAAQGVVLVNLDDPAAPRAQAYVPINSLSTGHGLLANDSLVIEDSGALKRFDLALENIPR